MMTVNEVSKISGVSIRTLQYYDSISLLKPADHTEAGYRLYDENSLERLQIILLFRELEFPLKDIKRIIDNPGFDTAKAIEQQIKLLELRREHIDNLLLLAKKIKKKGIKRVMDFSAFDKKKLEEYEAEAKMAWGDTDAYKEYAEKSKNRTPEESADIGKAIMEIFTEFGGMKDLPLESEEVQKQVKKLQDYITENMYTCTNEILLQLGSAYSAGGEMTENIDKAGGSGTGAFVEEAIKIFVSHSELV